MLKLRGKIGCIEFKYAVEVDELYVNAGLKGRNNSVRIKRLVERLDRNLSGSVNYGVTISQQYTC